MVLVVVVVVGCLYDKNTIKEPLNHCKDYFYYSETFFSAWEKIFPILAHFLKASKRLLQMV
jgi:hypothetical protein